jgi:phosphoribosylanthranilate isomerase
MDAIVEVHDADELVVAVSVEAPIVGVNSRDLKTMSIDLDRARRLLAEVPAGRLRVAESGIEDPSGLAVVRNVADAALIGTALMRSAAPAEAIAALRAAQVKICGVRTDAGADACESSGADYAGFNFVPGRRRAVTPDAARRLRARMPSVRTVGVFLDRPLEQVQQIASDVGLDAVQLHGAETPEDCAKVGHPVIKALRVDGGFDAGRAAAYRAAGATLLFDGPTPGEGRAFDTTRLGGVDLSGAFVAGGLTPENVGDVVRMLRPLAVDTASGVETADEMDPKKVERFIRRARGIGS